MARIPKLKIPFAVVNGGFRTVEQDSDDEIAQCVYAIMATPRGTRIEEPDFGITDPTFEQGGMDLGEALLACRTWEPRASVRTEQELDDMTSTVTVEVSRQ